MLSKTRLNMAIHVMNNSNDIFPGNISFYVTLLHSRKYYIFIEIISVHDIFTQFRWKNTCSRFKVVSSFPLSRRDGCVFKTLSSPVLCFFHGYCFLDFVSVLQTLPQFCIYAKCAIRSLSMSFCWDDTLSL